MSSSILTPASAKALISPADGGNAPKAISARKHPRTLCLFDVDETLTPARRSVSVEMLNLLAELKRDHCAIGFVGGSDLRKITEQLELPGGPSVKELFDYGFGENGLVGFSHGNDLPPTSFIEWIGEEKYQKLAKFCLKYIADLDIPVMRGTFIEFRNGMINVSPIGRNATLAERKAFNEYDKKAGVRTAFVSVLQKEFSDYGVRFSIGGEISFDVFPEGWDKTYALKRLTDEAAANGNASTGNLAQEQVPGWDEVHFFGDKTYEGGNDFEIFTDKRTIGHSVNGPSETIQELRKLFLS